MENKIMTTDKKSEYALKEATRLLKESAKLKKDAEALLKFVNKSLGMKK